VQSLHIAKAKQCDEDGVGCNEGDDILEDLLGCRISEDTSDFFGQDRHWRSSGGFLKGHSKPLGQGCHCRGHFDQILDSVMVDEDYRTEEATKTAFMKQREQPRADPTFSRSPSSQFD
jgi:hypothetical protein